MVSFFRNQALKLESVGPFILKPGYMSIVVISTPFLSPQMHSKMHVKMTILDFFYFLKPEKNPRVCINLLFIVP